jgi:lipopolysaccharide export system protein LptA
VKTGKSLKVKGKRGGQTVINIFNRKSSLFTLYLLLFTFLLALLFFAAPAAAQMQLVGSGQLTAPPGPFAGFKSTGKDPVEIVADRLEADLGSGNLRFVGHVRAKQGARTIYADRMEVVYTEGGEVTTLVATGGVKVNMGEAFASSNRLELDNKKQIIKLIGSPRVAQGRQVMTGDLITYYMKTEELTVSNPRIEWLPEPMKPGKPGVPLKPGKPGKPGAGAAASVSPVTPVPVPPAAPAQPAGAPK